MPHIYQVRSSPTPCESLQLGRSLQLCRLRDGAVNRLISRTGRDYLSPRYVTSFPRPPRSCLPCWLVRARTQRFDVDHGSPDVLCREFLGFCGQADGRLRTDRHQAPAPAARGVTHVGSPPRRGHEAAGINPAAFFVLQARTNLSPNTKWRSHDHHHIWNIHRALRRWQRNSHTVVLQRRQRRHRASQGHLRALRSPSSMSGRCPPTPRTLGCLGR